MNPKWVLSIFLLAVLATAQSQPSGQPREQEQSTFATEEAPGEPRVTHPVPVPDAVLQILQAENRVKSCLGSNPLAPGQDLASRFIASGVHLDGQRETDVVVVPSFSSDEGTCFVSATGIGLFWILRRTGTQYQLVLTTWGGGLEILKTRTNGYRDIQTGTLGQAGRFLTTVTFRFDGKRYQQYREVTKERR